MARLRISERGLHAAGAWAAAAMLLAGPAAATGPADAPVAAATASASATTAAARGPRLVFWTADDCPACQIWKTSDRPAELAALKVSVATTVPPATPAAALPVVVVSKRRLADPPSSFRWPDTAEGAALQAGLGEAPALLPAFDFVCNGKPLRRLLGIAQWDSFWHAQARQLLKTCAPPAMTPAAAPAAASPSAS